jgi:5-methylcytosine-specific restriction endonuclease McrA
MATLISSFNRLSDQDLLREVGRLAARERDTTAGLVASLAVLDQRRLYLAEGYESLFTYCTHTLRLSESATYKRIAAARAAQRFPVILERLATGDVTLTAVRLLAPHLTEANHIALLDEVRQCSTRAVEQIVARLHPRPDVPSTVRKLPTPPAASEMAPPPLKVSIPEEAGAAPTPAPARDEAPPSGEPRVRNAAATTHPPARGLPPNRPRSIVTPLAPARFKVSFTIGAETYAKLREAQDLLRHAIPDGDVAALFDRALTLLLREAAKTKHAATAQPRAPRGSSPRPVGPSSDDGRTGVPGCVEARPAQGPESRRATRPVAETPEQGTSTGRQVVPDGPSAGSTTPARPKGRSRHIPADVKRRVWTRDGGQCAFVSASGQRCLARGLLEYHHLVPYGAGGEASVENIALRCRAHHAHESAQVFGPWPPSWVREARPSSGGDGVTAREEQGRAHERHMFTGVHGHAGHATTGRAASSGRPPPHRI